MTLWRNDPCREPSLPGSDQRPRVLLVHPDQAGRAYTGKLLENLGNVVTACSSFEEGINFLETEKWDFIVVSQGGVTFPGRGVLERAAEIDRRVPVLVLTRYHEMYCYMDAMQLGAVDYLEEPASPPELARVVRTHLQGMPSPDRRRKPRRLSLGRWRTSPATQGA